MKWTATILAAVILMVVFSTGVALAVSLTGTDRTDILHRADRTEQISGLGGEDQLQGGDLVKGGPGSDELGRGGVYGGGGVDNLIGYGGDASLGRFYGGAGNDTV